MYLFFFFNDLVTVHKRKKINLKKNGKKKRDELH